MTPIRLSQALLVAAIASVAVVGCKKKEEAPPVIEPTPAPAPAEPAPAPAPAPTASVASVDLGSATGPDMKLSTMTASFKPNDKIIVSVATNTSDPAATVAGKLDVKLSYVNGAEMMDVDSQSRDFNLTGPGTTNVEFAKPSGWPTGKYKVDVSLNGTMVQSKELEVVK